MDGFPSDVTGSLFHSLLNCVSPTIERLEWTRVAVSDVHLSRMINRWGSLRILRIGIVTPYMWGVRHIFTTIGFNTLSISAALGAGGTTAGFWDQDPTSTGFGRLLKSSQLLETLSIEPLPGDDGTAWLLDVLAQSAPRSLRCIELGRGRYLMASHYSATRVWRAFVVFLLKVSGVEKAVVVDPFLSIRSSCPALWLLSDNYLNATAAASDAVVLDGEGAGGGGGGEVGGSSSGGGGSSAGDNFGTLVEAAAALNARVNQRGNGDGRGRSYPLINEALNPWSPSVVIFSMRGLRTLRSLS
ncbi:hypothetical protein HDU76_011404, partial [Blyttiomyces sp. JEL0837]